MTSPQHTLDHVIDLTERAATHLERAASADTAGEAKGFGWNAVELLRVAADRAEKALKEMP